MRVTSKEVAKKLMTPARLEILKFLSNYQFGTTQQIWQELQPHKNRNHTGGDLNKLRSLGLISSFAYQPERGTNSELCWLLLAAGAKILEEAGYPSNLAITITANPAGSGFNNVTVNWLWPVR